MEIKAIIYDFDGVICDSVDVKTVAFAALYEPYGAAIQEEVVKYHLLNGGISRFEKIRYYHRILLDIDISDAEVDQLAARFADLVKEKVIKAPYIRGADIFLKNSSDKVMQYICTGTPEYEILDIIKKKNLAPFFKGIYGAPKKKTAIIADILKESNYDVSNYLYIGDAITDYDAAMTHRMPFLGVLNSTTEFPRGTKVISDFHGLSIDNISDSVFFS